MKALNRVDVRTFLKPGTFDGPQSQRDYPVLDDYPFGDDVG